MRDDSDEHIFWTAARRSLGIYPEAWSNQDGLMTRRTAWQDGWNAAVIALIDRYRTLGRWAGRLTETELDALLVLLQREIVFLTIDADGTVTLELMLNDLFVRAADSEEVAPSDLPVLLGVWRDHHAWDGIAAWVTLRRGEEPLERFRTETYRAALRALAAGGA